MTNLFDYVLQYGDLSFEEKEFNEVDNLVFCLISYLDFSNTKINDGDKEMLDKYLTFLKSGSNDYPTNLVEKMGINIKDAVNTALNTFDKLIEEYKKL